MGLHLKLSRPRRPRRAGEWTADRAVTFIVTLAAAQSVTLAARRAEMSRKSAYALKGRDPAFAAAWAVALTAADDIRVQRLGRSRFKGDKVEEVHDPPVSFTQGDAGSAPEPSGPGAAQS